MPRKAVELSALEVKNLTTPGLHFVGGVAGLALQVVSAESRSWVLRIMVGTKRRDMGPGGYPDVTLAGAKEACLVALPCGRLWAASGRPAWWPGVRLSAVQPPGLSKPA